MVTAFIGTLFLLELTASALTIVFCQQYYPAAAFIIAIPLMLVSAKAAFAASLIRPSMWLIWGNLYLIFLPLSAYDLLVSHDLSLWTAAGHLTLWTGSLFSAWLCRSSF